MRLGVEAALVRGVRVRGDVEIAAGRVVAVGLSPGRHGLLAVPGFIDMQVNGYGGVDFLSASVADYERAGEALLSAGITAYQPTFITSPESAIAEALRVLPGEWNGPRVLGAHLEGPFLSKERPGAHPVEHLREPDVALLDQLLDAGRVTEMTLAPELPGADALVARLRERGVVVSAGHTNATAAEAHHAFNLGVGAVTHLFNAMRPLRGRDPGIVGAALTRADVVVTLIVDGHHLSDEVVRLVVNCAPGRVALITDAIAAAGMGAGRFRLGGAVPVSVAGDAAPALADGTLAGTALSMIEAVQNLHALGCSLEQAVGAATSVPARLLGRTDAGVLDVGALADVVVLDDRLEIVSVICGGKPRFLA